MGLVDIVILTVVGVALFFAVRAVHQSRKKGQCVGCRKNGCDACCHQVALKSERQD